VNLLKSLSLRHHVVLPSTAPLEMDLIGSPLAQLSQRLNASVRESWTWRVIPMCILVSGADVGLQIDTAPLPAAADPTGRFVIFAGCSRDGALGVFARAL